MNMNRLAAATPKQVAIGHCRAELLLSRPYLAAYTPGVAVLGFAFERQSGIHSFASDRRTAFRTKPNSLAYVPAGCDVFSQSSQGGEYLKLTFDPASGDRGFTQRLFNNLVDRPAIDAAQQLRRLMLAGDGFDPLAFERYALDLQERALLALNGAYQEARIGTWMTARRMRLVDELIDARLDAKLTVQDLADTLGLSAGFFARAFKAAIGKTPHAYIIDRRIAYARVLLDSTTHRLNTVALDAGFSSHAHMTDAFRQRLGITPSEYRKRFT